MFLLRANARQSEDPVTPGSHPDSIYAWTIGARRARPLAFRARDGHIGVVTFLTLTGTEAAFVTSPPGIVAIEGLWVQRLGGSPRLIEGISVGQGAECQSTFLSPTIVDDSLYAFRQDCDQFQPKRWSATA